MTNLWDALEKHSVRLQGKAISIAEAKALTEALKPVEIGWLTQLMIRFKLVGTMFSIESRHDLSGFGAEMRWLSPAGIIVEATQAYPGIAAIRSGFVPVADDLTGGGDPYFVQAAMGVRSPLYRIRHDIVDAQNDVLLDGAVEIVLEDLGDLVVCAT